MDTTTKKTKTQHTRRQPTENTNSDTIKKNNNINKTYCGYCCEAQQPGSIQWHTEQKHYAELERSGALLLTDATQQCPHCLCSLVNILQKFRHIKHCFANHARPSYTCTICPATFRREYNLKLHFDRVHGDGRKASKSVTNNVQYVSAGAAPAELTKTDRDSLVKRFINHEVPVNKLYELRTSSTIVSDTHSMSQSTYGIRFSLMGQTLATSGNVTPLLEAIARDLLTKTDDLFQVKPNYLYQITLDSPGALDYPISGPFQNSLDFSAIFNRLSAVSQSAKAVQWAPDIILEITERKQLRLKGKNNFNLSHFNHSFDEFCRRKKSIHDPTFIQEHIHHKYHINYACVPVAIALALYPIFRLKTSWYECVVESIRLLMPRFLEQCAEIQNISGGLEGCTMAHLPQIGTLLWDKYAKQLVVVTIEDDDNKFNVVYGYIKQQARTEPTCLEQVPALRTNTDRIYLLAHNDHVYYISNPRGCFPSSFLCKYCEYPRQKKQRPTGVQWACLNADCLRRKLNSCYMCGLRSCRAIPTLTTVDLFCSICNHLARNQTCYAAHLFNDGTECLNTSIRCMTCYRIYEKETFNQVAHNESKCKWHKCSTCKGSYDIRFKAEHECYMSPIYKTMDPKHTIYFDCETYTEASGRVQVNVVCCIITCKLCRHIFSNQPQECCGIRHLAFTGVNCLREFIETIILGSKYSNYILMAHFLSGFDGQLLLEQVVAMQVPVKQLLARGMKMMTAVLGHNKCHLRDSYLIYPVSLNNFCRAMGIPMLKGFAPILWNSETTMRSHTDEHPPPRKYFVVPHDRQQEFNTFYNSIRDKKYNFKKEMIDYCMQDVQLLWEAAEKFRIHIHNQVKIPNIYGAAMTSAGAAMKIFRSTFVKPKTLPLIFEHMPTARNSHFAMKYINYMNACHHYNFIHNGNSRTGEHRVAGYFVDGYDVNNNCILEVLGCEVGDGIDNIQQAHNCLCFQYHSHLDAMCEHKRAPSARNVFDKQFTHQQVFDMTMIRLHVIQSHGYQVLVRWECEIKLQLAVNREFKQFWYRMRHLDWNMNIRNALFGG
jgi:hypothetical protein